MARTHGKSADLSFNGVALGGWLDTVTLNASVSPGDITAFTDAYQNALSGKKNVTLELSGTMDTAAAAIDATIFAAIGAGAKSTIFDPTGAGPAANAPEYQCTASGLAGTLVKSYSISLPVGEKASIKVSLQNSGLTSRAVA